MSGTGELEHWLEEVSGPEWLWHAKFLSANDTYAKPQVHQAGPYLAKELLAEAFPQTCKRADSERNPELWLNARIDSHQWVDDIRLVWYNSKRLESRSNGRDEARLTNWGGKTSPIVEPDVTGSLVVFAFHAPPHKDAGQVRIWIARNEAELDRLSELLDEVAPGRSLTLRAGGPLLSAEPGPCWLKREAMPEAWIQDFPSGADIVAWVMKHRPAFRRLDADKRLLRRIACEFELFQSLEQEHVLPRVREGFASVDAFVQFANRVTNRRKSRAGRSLEIQAAAIFDEEEVSYSHGEQTEGARTPDFIFPSIDRYQERSWPDSRLRMLGAKTTCKDRWRQILNEAERIPRKHLLTLQEGVSSQQFSEMAEEGVILVVPAGRMKCYPDDVKPHLLSLERFLGEVRAL